MPGGGIDYSKWDHLDEYSDDDDGNGDGVVESNASPRVTRLDAPSSVTFGGSDNNAIEVDSSMKQNATAVSTTATTEAKMGLTVGNNAIGPAGKANAGTERLEKEEEKWCVKGGKVTSNDNRQIYWTQDRYSVTIRCQLFGNEKPKLVSVDGILPYADRHCAMGTTKPLLKTVEGKNKILLEGNLPHPVHLANDDDDIDWCIERRKNKDGDTKFIAITLYKAVPMQGLFIWWKRPFMEYDEINIDQEPSQASKEFLQAWEEAHKLFKEKKIRY